MFAQKMEDFFETPVKTLPTGLALKKQVIKFTAIIGSVIALFIMVDRNTVNSQKPAECAKGEIAVVVPRPHIWGIESFVVDSRPRLRDIVAEKTPTVAIATIAKLNKLEVMSSFPKVSGGVYCMQKPGTTVKTEDSSFHLETVGTGEPASQPDLGHFRILNDAQLAQVVRYAGWSGNHARIAFAVAKAESGGDTKARCYNVAGHCTKTLKHLATSVDRGLFQINNKAHSSVSDTCADDALCNARYAHTLSLSSRGWRNWMAYSSGSYRKFLDEARKAGL
jgi:hypothetical protein